MKQLIIAVFCCSRIPGIIIPRFAARRLRDRRIAGAALAGHSRGYKSGPESHWSPSSTM
jgi:hypothetical protein